MRNVLVASTVVLLLLPALAVAADMPGSKDPAGFKRFEGAEIIHYSSNNYAPYLMARAEGTVGEPGFEKTERVEGALTRVVYAIPEGHSGLEVFRNYQRMLEAEGYALTFELAKGTIAWHEYFADKVFFQGEMAARRPHEDDPLRDAKAGYYATAQRTNVGRLIDVPARIFNDVLARDYHEGIMTLVKFEPKSP